MQLKTGSLDRLLSSLMPSQARTKVQTSSGDIGVFS